MSMFTGLYPSEHGFVALKDQQRLADSVPTLAGILRERGYRTVAFTGGVNVARVYGFDQGFDEYRSNGRTFRDNLEETRFWLREHAGEKFFLFWHGYDAHTPYLPDPTDRRDMGMAEQRPKHGLRAVCRTKRLQRYIDHHLDEYDGAVRRGDRYVGKLIAQLDELDLLDRTLIVFTSDHGEEFLEHGRCFHLNTLYREVLHVPLIVAAPGLEPRRVAGAVPASVAIGPTLLALAGVRDHELPGPSLASASQGEDVPDEPVISETSRKLQDGRGRGHVRALTRDEEKLIDWITQQSREYFGLVSDAGERAPVASGRDHERLSDELDAWVRAHPRRDVQVEPAVSAADRARLDKQLRSLGYVD